MHYAEALAWLYGTQLTGIKLGLENMRRLLAALELQPLSLPQAAPPPPRFIHVAGTNGKGSVCAMLDAVCRRAGFRTGLFTSPHLITFRERIRLGGEMIPEQAVAEGLTWLRNLTEGWEMPPTFFELATGLALAWFVEKRAEIVILETGLGGRLDATNVIIPAVSVITEIGLDHIAMLGGSLAAIAGEKAGIIKAGVPVVSVPQPDEAAEVIRRAAQEAGAPLSRVDTPLPGDWKVNLAGSHQRMNAALALRALEIAGLPIPAAAAREGLAQVVWPGRFQSLEDARVILDGAHNPAAARRLVMTWREEMGEGTLATLVLGVMRDKDAAGVCVALGPVAARIIAVAPRSPRAMAADILCQTASAASPVECGMAGGLADALARAREWPEPVLVAGSLFLVGEALALLTGTGAPEISWQ